MAIVDITVNDIKYGYFKEVCIPRSQPKPHDSLKKPPCRYPPVSLKEGPLANPGDSWCASIFAAKISKMGNSKSPNYNLYI